MWMITPSRPNLTLQYLIWRMGVTDKYVWVQYHLEILMVVAQEQKVTAVTEVTQQAVVELLLVAVTVVTDVQVRQETEITAQLTVAVVAAAQVQASRTQAAMGQTVE
jgi:hypothetical protein